MGLFANVAALAERLDSKQKFTKFGVYQWKKKVFFHRPPKKKITYFIVILKTLDAIALLELSESVVKSRFLEENPASAV